MEQQTTVCTSGVSQSPIEIISQEAVLCRNKCNLLFYYRSSRCHLIRQGRSLLLDYDEGSHVIFNGDIYELEKISFTNPSSHIIDKSSGAMEMHLYHRAPDTGKILVIAIIYEVNEASSLSRVFFDNWTHLIPTTEDKEVLVTMSSEWNVFQAIPEIKSFYTYDGSLVQQPCTESITWIVFAKFANISEGSYNKIVSVIGDNARKVQSTNKRTVLFNPNSSNRTNINQSNPIFCLTDEQLRNRCAALNGDKNKNESRYGNTKLLMSIIIILVFLFILFLCILYKFGFFKKIAESVRPAMNGKIGIKGIGNS